jgi:hypothetical protein
VLGENGSDRRTCEAGAITFSRMILRWQKNAKSDPLTGDKRHDREQERGRNSLRHVAMRRAVPREKLGAVSRI